MKQVPDATLTRITELLRTLNSGAFTVQPGAFTDLVAELDAIQGAKPEPMRPADVYGAFRTTA